MIGRREFITLLGGAAAWPVAARAQPSDRMRHIGVLMNTAADDPEGKARNAAFERGLQELGWTDGRNVRIDYRWGAVKRLFWNSTKDLKGGDGRRGRGACELGIDVSPPPIWGVNLIHDPN